jgi:hypothetical protein
VPLLILLYTFGQHIPVLSPLASLIGPTEGDASDADEEDEGKKAVGSDSAPDEPAHAPSVSALPVGAAARRG